MVITQKKSLKIWSIVKVSLVRGCPRNVYCVKASKDYGGTQRPLSFVVVDFR